MTSFESRFFSDPSPARLLADMHSPCFPTPWNEQDFRQLLTVPGTIAQIIETGGPDPRPVAFGVYRVCIDEAEILTLGVLPGNRGTGAGDFMLLSALGYLRQQQAETLFLEVSETNIPAQNLYLRRGFSIIGRRKNYYREDGQPVNALIMERKTGQPETGA
ncbi:GNAT family N-acetyltransferase [Sneathiella chinensis]|uniref:Alanine acetyltransferase n=1 Tax=Sneathiella chinensis TaxID=349750 RepID=A0ABQ5U1B1_9PROT|nr:GNAT family N-acetyltransferase [Sneathiella chinensis]GLQ05211.1 alanine acetyltransferase [Sneathiella chinensis]